MTVRTIAAALGCLLLAPCAGARERPAPCTENTGQRDWRTIVTPADRVRLRNWREAWMEGVAQVQARDGSAALSSYGALFATDRTLADPLPPPGDYVCRTVKLGTRTAGLPAIVAAPWFDCRIDREQNALAFTQDRGVQRPVGLMFRDTATRGVFLGTVLLVDESSPLRYGQDNARDAAGIVERIDPQRWRMTLPYPAFDSTVDVIELVPASARR